MRGMRGGIFALLKARMPLKLNAWGRQERRRARKDADGTRKEVSSPKSVGGDDMEAQEDARLQQQLLMSEQIRYPAQASLMNVTLTVRRMLVQRAWTWLPISSLVK